MNDDVLKYRGPNNLRDIEARLLEIEREKPMRVYNASENYSGSFEDEVEENNIAYLDVEKSQLQLKRQFILDERNSWKAKGVWNVIVPVIVSLITTYIVSILLGR